MIAGGLYIGFAQDTYRRLATLWRNNRLLVYLFEIAFWLIQTIVLFYMLYRVNDGEIRLYIVLACFLGFSMYVVFLQKVYLRVLDWLTLIIKKTLVIIYRIISVPILFLFRLIKAIIIMLWNVCYKVILFFWKMIYFLLKKILPKKVLDFISKITIFCSTMINKLSLLIKNLYR